MIAFLLLAFPGSMDDTVGLAGSASAAVVSVHNPFTASAIMLSGKSMSIWQSVNDSAPAENLLPAAPLIDRSILTGVEDNAPVRSASENYNEAQAYNYLLITAHKTPAAGLARGARRDLTYTHLFEEPQKYRGQLVHLEGKLRQLTQYDATSAAAKEGVPTLYEGWLFGADDNGSAYCLIVSELPPMLKPGKKLDYAVSFDGYLFKRYRYKAAGAVRLETPLLIGRTFVPMEEPPTALESSYSEWLLPAFFSLLALTVVLAVGLGWFFRQGDRRVKAKLEITRLPAYFAGDEPPGIEN